MWGSKTKPQYFPSMCENSVAAEFLNSNKWVWKCCQNKNGYYLCKYNFILKVVVLTVEVIIAISYHS